MSSATVRINGTMTAQQSGFDGTLLSTSADLRATQMRHAYKPGTHFGFVIGGTPTTREEIVWTASAAGTINGFHCLCNDTGSSASVTFDLKKNGTTVLSAVVTITNATTDKAVQDGTVSVASYVADDILSIALTVSSSTGMQGTFAWAEIEEVYSP